ncbi:unnamed protein product, partial [Iphiclides podalirius]
MDREKYRGLQKTGVTSGGGGSRERRGAVRRRSRHNTDKRAFSHRKTQVPSAEVLPKTRRLWQTVGVARGPTGEGGGRNSFTIGYEGVLMRAAIGGIHGFA